VIPTSEPAPGKINLCLHLGPVRPDGRHELVTLMQAVSLADRLTLRDHGGPVDEVRCPGVDGPNICAAALAAFRRSTGWAGPPQLVEIDKRVPVAAGMGGGSGDAAATLRLVFARAGVVDDALELELATALGADVPGQLRPGRVLATGAGERVVRLPDPAPFGVLILPGPAGLSTADVYAQADRMGLGRTAEGLAGVDPVDRLEHVNDLEPAARALDPSIDVRLALARRLGARPAMVSGSGPTVFGLFASPAAARRAARAAAGCAPAPLAAIPFVGGVRHNPGARP
jgi:4-diphosphocytidyl-2-C-methyl-D-erythritol kinase